MRAPLASLLLALAAGLDARPVPKVPRPNILLIVADDLGAQDLGFAGSLFHRTPHLDRLAKAGVTFTQATAPSPVCSPSRASLLTGQHPARLGVTDEIGARVARRTLVTPEKGDCLPEGAPTLGDVFTQAGYRTGYIGKWHLGIAEAHPKVRGFTWTFAVNGSGHPASHFFPYQAARPSLWDVPDLEEGSPGDYLADQLTKAAEGFLDAKAREPFLLVVSHYAVHTPLEAPEAAVAEQRARAAALPPQDSPTVAEVHGSRTRRRQDHPVYAAMVENLDANVGRLLAHLKRRGLDRNTVVVFVSDNGGLSTLEGQGAAPTSNAPLRAGKGWLYDGGLRVPLLVSGPGVKGGQVRSEPASATDLLPTLLDLAGVRARPEAAKDGCSLVPLLKGGRLPARDLFWHYPHDHGSGSRPASAVRSGDLKLIHWLEDDRVELFDLAADPGETRDLAPARPEEAARLKARLEAWRAGIGARMPVRSPDGG